MANEVFARADSGVLWRYWFQGGALCGMQYVPLNGNISDLNGWTSWSAAEREAIDALSLKEYGVKYFKETR